MRLAPLVLLLVACSNETTLSGTAVGNADASVAVTTPTGQGVASFTASVPLDTFSAVDCDGHVRVLASGLDLPLDGSASLGIPAGTWCGFELAAADVATWRATSTAGFALTIALDVGALSAVSTTPFEVVTDGQLVWQLGDRPWLDAVVLGADVADVTIAAGHPRYDELLGAASDHPVLFEDVDGDGRLGDGEGAWVGDDGSHPPPRPGPGFPPP